MSDLDQYFIPENERPEFRQQRTSPSGKYELVTTAYGTKPGCWSVTEGAVRIAGSDGHIATVRRNYSAFPFLFVEGHPNGHDYLICGEDYQGQTIIELDTGKRRDYLPEAAAKGHGFCWSSYRFDATAQILIVCGCFWACPYEFRFYDFAAPMDGWPELVMDGWADEDRRRPTVEPDGTIKCYESDPEPEDYYEEAEWEGDLAVVKTFRREGLKLVKVDEWVSDAEQKRRADREEGRKRWEAWLADFRANDPLYLAYVDLVKDPELSPEKHESHGITHEDWCPDFKERETRWCRRLIWSDAVSVELEWAVKTGPIKLEVYLDKKSAPDQFFPHTVAGMREAFTAAKAIIATSPAAAASPPQPAP